MTGFTLGKTSLAKLEGVHPDMVKVVKLAITYTTQDYSVHEGLRTKTRQANLVKTGASRTMNSKHIQQSDGYGHAVDLLPWGDFDGNGTIEVSFHWVTSTPSPRRCARRLRSWVSVCVGVVAGVR